MSLSLVFPWRTTNELGGHDLDVPVPFVEEPPTEPWEGVVRYVTGRRFWWLQITPIEDEHPIWELTLLSGFVGDRLTPPGVNPSAVIERRHQPAMWNIPGVGVAFDWTCALALALASLEARAVHDLQVARWATSSRTT